VALFLNLLDMIDREMSQNRTGLVFLHVRTSVLKPERTAEPATRTRVGSFGLTIRTLDASCECEKPMECAGEAGGAPQQRLGSRMLGVGDA
jgi:hypothetical protein